MSKYNEYFDKNNYEKFSEGIVSGNLAKKCFTFLKPKTATNLLLPCKMKLIKSFLSLALIAYNVMTDDNELL